MTITYGLDLNSFNAWSGAVGSREKVNAKN